MNTSNWVLRDTTSRTYERPLGITELGFYWDSKFNGTADTVRYAIIDIDAQGTIPNTRLFGVENVTRTWVALKQQYPLLGSKLSERQQREEVVFVVSEECLSRCTPEEISFQSISSQLDLSSLGELDAFMDGMVNGRRLLSNELVARLFILIPTGQEKRVCVILHVAHCITDGISNATLLRSFLDILSSEPRTVRWDLEERLTLAIASERLLGRTNSNKARQRWYYAVGRILASNGMKIRTGGHTLPRELTLLTRFTPARSGFTSISFSAEASQRIMRTCRSKVIPFGNAFTVLGQVALTRVICRRYIRGDIDKDEWEYRRREPMSTGSPHNLRPFLNQQWFELGGSSNVSVSISFFFHTLPFMPLGASSGLAPGDVLPEFQDLLSPARFWLRCNLVMQQTRSLHRHPLFPYCLVLGRAVEARKETALCWEAQGGTQERVAGRVISTVEQGQTYGPVMSHGGSSFGNTDNLIPSKYPLSQVASELPVLRVCDTGTRLHCRPAELYLGASTVRRQLGFYVFYDQNVFDKEMVEEWLGEVRGAAEFYLGQAERPEARL